MTQKNWSRPLPTRPEIKLAQCARGPKIACGRLGEMESNILDRTKAAAKATDQLVHENPWQSIALATAVGFLLGMLTGRR